MDRDDTSARPKVPLHGSGLQCESCRVEGLRASCCVFSEFFSEWFPDADSVTPSFLSSWRSYAEVECKHWDYVPFEGDEVPHWGGGV